MRHTYFETAANPLKQYPGKGLVFLTPGVRVPIFKTLLAGWVPCYELPWSWSDRVLFITPPE